MTGCDLSSENRCRLCLPLDNSSRVRPRDCPESGLRGGAGGVGRLGHRAHAFPSRRPGPPQLRRQPCHLASDTGGVDPPPRGSRPQLRGPLCHGRQPAGLGDRLVVGVRLDLPALHRVVQLRPLHPLCRQGTSRSAVLQRGHPHHRRLWRRSGHRRSAPFGGDHGGSERLRRPVVGDRFRPRRLSAHQPASQHRPAACRRWLARAGGSGPAREPSRTFEAHGHSPGLDGGPRAHQALSNPLLLRIG